MVAEFECLKCGNVVSLEQYESSKFCPKCGTFLQARRLKIARKTVTDLKPKEIKREDVDVESLFYEYLHKSPIDTGGGVFFRNVDSWIFARKQAYKNYREKFAPDKLHEIGRVSRDFKDWLLFRNNKSWTTLQRTGNYAVSRPEKLADLLFLLQDEEIDVGIRVQRGLKGKEKVYGIAEGILTALLHTFFDDKYGVWNSRTKDTLEILRRSPIYYTGYLNIGQKYKEINKELHKLARELDTDLTTLDGFMWYISKFVIFI